MNIVPTVLEKSSNREYAYDLYSRLLKDRIVFLTGEIDDTTANLVVSELLYLDSLNHDEICLYINSPGGSVIGSRRRNRASARDAAISRPRVGGCRAVRGHHFIPADQGAGSPRRKG